MPEDANSHRIQARIEKSEAAVATFARIGEEFRTMRKEMPPGEARDRIDRMIALNEQTAAVVRRALCAREGDLGHQKD